MANSQQQDKQLEQKLRFVNTVEIHSFISEFHNSNASNKTFSFIEENFIKKYRYKNSLPQNNSDPHSTVTQFINGFKQTIKFYQSYHQYLQSTLDKFMFAKDLKRFITQLYKSQTKTMNFFLTQLQFHRVFMAQNEAKYNKKVESLNEICSSCKQSMVRKSFQSIKQQVGYNFSDPYKLYQKGKYSRLNDLNHLSYLDSMHPLQQIQQLQQANIKMRELIKESKKIDFSKLDEIYDHFDTRQQFSIQTLNKGKVNEMFYDLQTQLDCQSSQLQQYVDQLVGFNDRLINYHPNTGMKMLEQQEKDQTEPKDVEKQLKYNFSKIIRKIYKKITQIIQKRKLQAISQETQVNFTQQSALKQMQKQKRRLQLQLKQSKQQKKFLTTALKQQNDTLKKQIQRLTQENNKIDISKQQTLLQKNNIQRKQEKLINVINQLKKQIQRLNTVIDRRQYLASKKQLMMGESKLKSRLTLDNNEVQEIKEQDKQGKHEKHDHTKSKRTSKRHLMAVSKIEHHEHQSQSILSNNSVKSPEQQLLEQMQRHELQLINSLAKKKLKNNKKKFLQPRRSKITEVITLQDSDLKKQVNRLSQARLKEMQELNRLTEQEQQKTQAEDEYNEDQDEQFDDQFLENQSSEVERNIKEPTIKEVIERNQNQEQSQQQDEVSSHQLPKNHKSKTFTKINQQYELQSNQRGKSSRCVSETQEDILQKLDQLRKLKKMKQLEIKLAIISNKNPDGSFKKPNFPHRSPDRFKIQKQVQQSIMAPKINKSVDKMNSLTKKPLPNRGAHHQSLYKDDLLKRFGRSSQNFQQSPIQSKPSLSHLQLPSSSQNPKSSQQKRTSSISIPSKNFLSMCEQVTKLIEEQKSHIGTQTMWPREEILRMLYEFELQARNWNEILVPFDCYKFGYQEFMSQLCQLIAKQQKNPIRRLNGYKGSSDVLKKPHNYRFNKQNLYYFNSYGQRQEQGLNLSEDDIKMKKMFSKTSDEKHYFVPRFSSQLSKSFIDDPRMNQTTIAGFYGHKKDYNEQNQQQNISQKPLTSCVSLAQLKNAQKHPKNFDPSVLFNEANNGNFKKKGFYTLHQMKTDGNLRETVNELGSKDKLPTINENLEMIRMPTFQRQDAENLFFTIESAKTIEENIRNNLLKNQSTFFTLEKQQIRFSTQILAILAHVHLLQPQSYNQIKNMIIYPSRILANKKAQIQLSINNQNENNLPQDNETQLSLKNGLGYVIQLHRKCNLKNSSDKQRSRTKDNMRLVQNTLSFKTKTMCEHLISFRKKIGQVIRVHQALKTKVIMQ